MPAICKIFTPGEQCTGILVINILVWTENRQTIHRYRNVFQEIIASRHFAAISVFYFQLANCQGIVLQIDTNPSYLAVVFLAYMHDLDAFYFACRRNCSFLQVALGWYYNTNQILIKISNIKKR